LKLAAIDIGSNSIKIVVVEAASSASFDVLASDRETVRLGQETIVNKHISSAAMQRAVECLQRFRALAETHGAEEIVVTATAFLRAADNAGEFTEGIEAETGLRVNVISGIEEARLIGLAAAHGCTEKGATSLNIDIGGGSTEISIFRDDEPLKLISINLGAVGLTDRFIRSDPPAPDELDALRSEIRASFKHAVSELREYSWDQATATSGTATTLGAALNHVWPPAPTTVTLAQLKQFNERLGALTIAERRTIPGIMPQRADIIVAGGVVLEEVMSAFGIESLQTCDWSLREGVIIDQLRKQNGR
jgi:exopolyphosphatase/guanosine-5'-triphosphate,3'-diphosphate pyrophosphatase